MLPTLLLVRPNGGADFPPRLALSATLFFSLYQVASMVVLSFTSAQMHFLLNVGKRIFNVLIAVYVFGESVGTRGEAGLVLAACGGVLYSTRGVANIRRKYGGALVPVLLFLTSRNLIGTYRQAATVGEEALTFLPPKSDIASPFEPTLELGREPLVLCEADKFQMKCAARQRAENQTVSARPLFAEYFTGELVCLLPEM